MKNFSCTAKTPTLHLLFLALSSILVYGCSKSTSLQNFQKNAPEQIENNLRITDFTFNGYTTHWQDHYNRQIRYSNLIRFDIPDIPRTILQAKINIAEDIGLPGLKMQEGFLQSLLAHSYRSMENPTISELEKALMKDDVLVYVNSESKIGQQLNSQKATDIFPVNVQAHQYGDYAIPDVQAYMMADGERQLWVISTPTDESRSAIQSLILNVSQITDQYDLHKGWFGVQTLLKSVTATPGHPIDVIGKGLNEGCSWFVFDGYMEFLARHEITDWVDQARIPVVTDVGFFPVYGCTDYDNLQVQTMFTPEKWLEFAQDHGCYIFRRAYDDHADSMDLSYDGYRATPGNKEQIDTENVPFVLPTGNLLSGTIPSMVLFVKKGSQFDKDLMWDAIMDRRAVGIAEEGLMMGPESFRQVLGMLILDRRYLEKYFKDDILLEAHMENYTLRLRIKNTTDKPISGNTILNLPPGLTTISSLQEKIYIPAEQQLILKIPLQPQPPAMDHSNAVGITFQWEEDQKSTSTLLNLPPVITAAPVAYGQPTGLVFPVTIHNYSPTPTIPVTVEVFPDGKSGNPVWIKTKTLTIPKGSYKTMNLDMKLEPGNYNIQTTALNTTFETQIGIREDTGEPSLKRKDLDQDGVDEFILENDSVRVTLLTTGARVIDYTIKSKKDNILFKLWPRKPIDDRRPFRKRGFYPFGGFEDFLGQPSIETHKVYDAEVLSTSQHQVTVRMTAQYFGGNIQKTFTLYGNSPLLEVGFAVTMDHPELNVLGPQPIVELGSVHGPEDVFIIPETEGNKEYRMMPERYFGRIAYLREGWNAGWDSEENIAFAGAFPVDLPLFLHMWMNHPSNRDAHHYYAEFQPWIPIPPHSTLHFNYYIWGNSGSWQSSVDALRSRNLIEQTQK